MQVSIKHMMLTKCLLHTLYISGDVSLGDVELDVKTFIERLSYPKHTTVLI